MWKWVRRSTIAFIYDVLMVPVAFLGAYLLRYNFDLNDIEVIDTAIYLLPVLLVIQTICNFSFGLYRGVWRFASMQDLMRILKAVLMGTISLITVSFFVTRAAELPRSVMFIYALNLVFLLGGARFAFRWFKDQQIIFLKNGKDRVLILGFGLPAEAFIRDLKRNRFSFTPIGILDDDTSIGKEIHGVRVLGKIDILRSIIKNQDIDLIVIALENASSTQMHDLMNLSEEMRIPCRVLPTVEDVVQGRIKVELREIALEDLLGRISVQLNWDQISLEVTDKVVMVTGAGGSIGSELCRQLLYLQPRLLVATDRNEYQLFELQRELKSNYPNLNIEFRLLDICDQDAISYTLHHFSPQIVFHAAAYKHVPMLENQVREAMRNNVLGTWYLAQEVIKHKVAKLVLVSSDKAVNPANVMGSTKRLSEMIISAYQEQNVTQFITVRFGNVLGSTGSVVPIFKEQLQKGGPITVTHPEVSRYFMTIPEAAQLILQASIFGQGGEIFVLDMGEPIKIIYLAEQIIRLSGKKPYEEVDIMFTGLRPGEKLHEELFYQNENLLPTTHHKIYRAGAKQVDLLFMTSQLELIEEAVKHYRESTLLQLLHQMTHGDEKNIVLPTKVIA